MGPYCKFCGRRCFVYRVAPDGPSKGRGGLMATCADGMAFDLEKLGHTHLTSVNPITDPEAAERIGAEVAGERGRKATALAVEAAELCWFASQVDAMIFFPAQPPGVDRMTDADWLSIAITLRDHAAAYPLVKSYWDKAAPANVGLESNR